MGGPETQEDGSFIVSWGICSHVKFINSMMVGTEDIKSLRGQ